MLNALSAIRTLTGSEVRLPIWQSARFKILRPFIWRSPLSRRHGLSKVRRSYATVQCSNTDQSWRAPTYEASVASTTRKQHHDSETKSPRAGRPFESKRSLDAIAEDGSSKHELRPLLNLQLIQDTRSLPQKEQYPGAPLDLFDPKFASPAVHNLCQQRKVKINTTVEFSNGPNVEETVLWNSPNYKFAARQPIKVCNLQLEIPDVCREAAIGEDVSKAGAKQAAWLQLVSQLHVNGTLRKLCPSPSAEEEGPAVAPVDERNKVQTEPARIDRRTMDEQQDAKSEIYEYAAALGLVAIFDYKIVRPAPRGIVQVMICLPERNIDVSGLGENLVSAEVAAAIAFKREAEKQHIRKGNVQEPPQYRFDVLKMDTAREFIEFCQDRGHCDSLEMEHEEFNLGGYSLNSGRLTMNDTPFGKAVKMQTKEECEAAVYLTAAVEMARGNPHLLLDFEEELRKGSGHYLKPLRQRVDLKVDLPALQAMRSGLVEARNAGLPDSRAILEPEAIHDRQNVVRHRELPRPLSRFGDDQRGLQKLRLRQRRIETDPKLEEVRRKRTSLPVMQLRDQVEDIVSKNQYSIIVGAAGSGKTTQVPQILFEQALKLTQDSECNIVCTQPRRIAAISVARHVAAERGEPLSDTVGYHVRFDARVPHGPNGITFLTTGIFLRRLQSDADQVLNTTSHILVDEVHERDLENDFLMIVLRKAIQERRLAGKRVPKVVLMSATLDTSLFAEYFGQESADGSLQPCPVLDVPGRTYPVTEKYLGPILEELSQNPEVKVVLDSDKTTADFVRSENAFVANRSKHSPRQSGPVIEWKRAERPGANANDQAEALVPVALVAATIHQICSQGNRGAILAFLPGLEEIRQADEMLLNSSLFGTDFSDSSKFRIFHLHSSIPPDEQARVFEPMPRGCRKIILSTNIAETSVTVADVRYVVDSGRLHESRYDQNRRFKYLQCVWESNSNARQRAGRAGRVQDGFYYALFSKERRDSFSSIGLPELVRSDLQETCLSVGAHVNTGSIASFLTQAIQPPPGQAVEAAIDSLKAVNALTAEEQLTALGRLLSKLPVHPTFGKMIVLGVIFKCLDPMLIIGAAAGTPSLFLRPLRARVEAREAHAQYADTSQSDHNVFLNAFNDVRSAKLRHGTSGARRRAGTQFLSFRAFESLNRTASQVEQILVECGLVTAAHGKTRSSAQFGPVDLNRYSQNQALIKCLLLSGFHPNLAVKQAFNGVSCRTASQRRVFVHPASCNAGKRLGAEHPYGTLFTHSTLTKSTSDEQLYIRDTTLVTPLMAALFGGDLELDSHRALKMDDWLPLKVIAAKPEFASKLILEFRKALDRVLSSAFKSLSNLNAEVSGSFVDDPMREQFVKRLVEVLDLASGKHFQVDPWGSE